MINGIRIKVCGLTTLVDAEAADAGGADYLGFNLYPKSPRFVPFAQWQAMAGLLPPRRTVAITVCPSRDDLRRWREAGFDFIQIHFPPDTPVSEVDGWLEEAGSNHVWLVPRLPPETPVPPEILQRALTILWDTYSAGTYGGTGQPSDWAGFRAARETHPAITWILAGGLTPDNVAEALAATGARFLDVNSGVELAPGVKDPAKLQAFFAAVRAVSGPA